MMGEVINFNKRRKQKARDDRAAQAEINRAKFGISKFEKSQTGAEQDQISKSLDGAKLDREAEDDGQPGDDVHRE